MPFTYVSHQAPVLGLKLWRPAWFDGVALAFGSMAPDWAYVLNGSRASVNAHEWPAVMWFCIPTALIATSVLRYALPVLGTVLPSGGVLALREYRRLTQFRPWAVTATSLVIGIGSHVGWDLFTHDNRWGPRHIAWLRHVLSIDGHEITVAHLLQQVSTLVGGIVGLALLVWIGRHRLLRRWHPDEPRPFTCSVLRVWLSTAVATAAGVVWAMDRHGDRAAFVNRIVVAGGVTLLLVAATERWRQERAPSQVPTRP